MESLAGMTPLMSVGLAGTLKVGPRVQGEQFPGHVKDLSVDFEKRVGSCRYRDQSCTLTHGEGLEYKL